MNVAVDFHDQPLLHTAKVDNKWPKWMLPPKFQPIKPAAAQFILENRLRVRRSPSQRSRGGGVIPFQSWHPPSSPLSRAARERGRG